MVYRRKYAPRRNRRYRRNYSRSTAATASKALYLAKKANQTELKYNEIVSSLTPTVSVPTITVLSNVAQGTTNNTRIGDIIRPTSIMYHAKYTRASGDLSPSTFIRQIVFRWIGASTPTAADILQAPVTRPMTSFKNQDQTYQSQILSDRTFRLDLGEIEERVVKQKLKLKHFISFTEGASVAQRNQIWVLHLTDATVGPNVTFETRMYFKDK